MDPDKSSEVLATPPLESPPPNQQSTNEDNTSRPSVAAVEDSPSHSSYSFSVDKKDELCQVTGSLPVWTTLMNSLRNKYNLLFKRDHNTDIPEYPRESLVSSFFCCVRSTKAPSSSPYQQSDINVEATNRISVVDSLKDIYDDVYDNDTNVPEYSRIESLPWPPFKRILYFLRNDYNCADLNVLAQVSPRFRCGVKEFMGGTGNRPAIERVLLLKRNEGLELMMRLFPSNLPFYNLDNLDSGRFERTVKFSIPTLKVIVRGPEDPIIDQVSDLLSTAIHDLELDGLDGPFNVEDLSLAALLLRNSVFEVFAIEDLKIDDASAQLIFSIISRSSLKEIYIFADSTELSNPAAFMAQLNSLSPNVLLDSGDDDLFFGLSHFFWKKFLNEKLSTGSVDYIKVGGVPGEFTKAPFVVPQDLMGYLKWGKY